MNFVFILIVGVFCGAVWLYCGGRESQVVQVTHTKKKKRRNRVDITKKYQGAKKKSVATNHELLVVTMRGHSAPINSVSFSPNGKHILTSSEDRTLRIWRDFEETKNPPYYRENIQHAVSCSSFSGDGKYVLACLHDSCEVCFYRFRVKNGIPNLQHEFKFVASHASPITSVSMPSNNQFVLTCARGQDTEVKLWTPKGSLLHVINTNSIVNYMATASDDAKFISVATRMSGVKIWSVGYAKKGGGYEGVKHLFDLKGHKRAVNCVRFDAQSKHAITASIDGSWRLWGLDVQIHLEEEPRRIAKFQSDDEYLFCDVSISHNVVAVVNKLQSLTFHRPQNSKILEKINTAVTPGSEVTAMCFSQKGDRLATAGTDKAVRIWRVPKAV